MMVEIEGDGEPIMLVHGLGGTSNTWQPLLPALAGMRVIRPDLPGAGRSVTPKGVIDVPFLANALIRLASELGIETMHLVGHSFGTLVAQHVAATRPALVRSLTLFGPIIEPADVARERLRGRAKAVREHGMADVADQVASAGLASSAAQDNPTALAFVRESHMRQDAEGFAKSCEALAGADRAAASAIKCPVLAVAGDEDAVSPPGNAYQLADEIKGARAQILSGCGHWAPVEKPNECRQLLSEFLRG
ncbi:alpha/beta fold hydrolase [Hoeflea sp.]|uniref:alpha/beta fold hydrolase n=1 Tax=Hoeflea sp. TaxID=1940281 RepID=UPI001990DBC2|nr:alpha/beta fold hydrolase [Hoeflea sp.]MBC7283125.1 alpha/beta fold hydrolase [Hoeflea sp.]